MNDTPNICFIYSLPIKVMIDLKRRHVNSLLPKQGLNANKTAIYGIKRTHPKSYSCNAYPSFTSHKLEFKMFNSD